MKRLRFNCCSLAWLLWLLATRLHWRLLELVWESISACNKVSFLMGTSASSIAGHLRNMRHGKVGNRLLQAPASAIPEYFLHRYADNRKTDRTAWFSRGEPEICQEQWSTEEIPAAVLTCQETLSVRGLVIGHEVRLQSRREILPIIDCDETEKSCRNMMIWRKN